MSVTSLGSALSTNSDVAQLAKQIAAAVDTNQDGQVTTGEFASFLEQILGATGGESGASLQGSALPASGDAGPLSLMSEIPPSAWTGDSSPYGVTFAGFSQMDHTNLTLDDLAKPGAAEKYLAYDYLLSNKVAANQTWAPAAAQALNAQRGENVFKAVDGETLSFGNEFIHTAPNGWGLLPGAYDRSASSEFLWGVYDDAL